MTYTPASTFDERWKFIPCNNCVSCWGNLDEDEDGNHTYSDCTESCEELKAWQDGRVGYREGTSTD